MFFVIAACLATALFAAASAGLACERKAIVPVIAWSLVSAIGWAGALAAATTIA